MSSPKDPLQELANDLAESRFRPLRRLAMGGMGECWVVEHVELANEGAMKLLRPELVSAADLTKRLRAEGRMLMGLVHENLVRVLDFGWTRSKRAFLVTEFLKGETLGARLKARKALPLGEALALTRQMLSGLEVVHAAGLVHRDIKPDNLFLADLPGRDAPVLKILDFGIAKVLTPQAKALAGTIAATQTGMLVGTPSYASPEQVKGEPVGVTSDIYAVGCVLYRMLAGRPPFVRERQVDLLAAHVLDEPESLLATARVPVTSEVDALVMKCLEKDPANRFASAAELASAVDALIAAERARATPATLETARRPSPKTEVLRRDDDEATAFRPVRATALMARPAIEPGAEGQTAPWVRWRAAKVDKPVAPDGDSAHGTQYRDVLVEAVLARIASGDAPGVRRPKDRPQPSSEVPIEALRQPTVERRRTESSRAPLRRVAFLGIAAGLAVVLVIYLGVMLWSVYTRPGAGRTIPTSSAEPEARPR
jgi:serine/threonine-protein kinase